MAQGWFGPFELVARLGAGGMAEVWSVRREEKAQLSCIKRLREDLRGIRALGRALLEEGRIASRLTHRAIVRTRMAGEVDGVTFVEMDLVPGRDLARLLTRLRERGADDNDPASARLSPRVTSWIASETLAALAHAHEAGVIHRDVSPHNILLGWDGRVLLTDFGIAALRDEARSTLQRVAPAGGPGRIANGLELKAKTAYVSPEQARGGSGGPLSDLYSLGVGLWECLAGRRLFGPSEAPEIGAVAAGEAAPLLAEPCPAPLARFVARLVALDEAERPQSARAAIGDLAEVVRELWETDLEGPRGNDSAWSPTGGWQVASELFQVLERAFGDERAVEGQGNTARSTQRSASAGPEAAMAGLRVRELPASFSPPARLEVAPDPPRPIPPPPPAASQGAHWMWYAAAGSVGVLVAAVLATGGC